VRGPARRLRGASEAHFRRGRYPASSCAARSWSAGAIHRIIP
jgi:hypothetical protein